MDTFNPVDLLAGDALRQQAELEASKTRAPFNVQIVTIDLTSARTQGNEYSLQLPLKAIFVRDASDPNTYVNAAFHSNDALHMDSSIKMKLNDAFSLPMTAQKTFLTWPAQAGKSITLYLILEGDFRPGSQISVNAGGVSINSGSSFTHTPVVTLAAATPTVLFAANTSRKQGTVVNDSGATLYLGDATLDATTHKGLPIADGQSFIWQNTAALYAYSVAGCNLVTLEES